MTKNVSVKDLEISYGAHKIVEHLDIEIERGEFLVLLGPSGCGKSTLLSAIAGLAKVTGGTIHIGERDVTRAEPKSRGIGMVFQSYALYPTMSVRKNISFGLKMAGANAAEQARKVNEVAAFLQITQLLDRKPSQLSGGQRQRVAIGRALARSADIYLFDEPLSNLDAKLRNELRYEIKRLHSELGTTMVYVTHDQIEAMTLSTRIAVMKDGKIQQLATPSEIYARPANLFVAGFVGSPAMNFIEGDLRTNASGTSDFVGGGFSLSLPARYAQREVVLGIRPEQFLRNGSGVAGTVTMTEEMGPEGLFWLEVGGKKMSVRSSMSDLPRPGQKLEIGVDLSAMSLFCKETGARIGKPTQMPN
ncbi:ABC transporter ATP-binding protein (plasmid) [Rhizobium sp. CB3090]|uniref:ABC transporter ATP-binding protein n=1 Tax=Rhizobium sp. CB3090 TaxID=3039156 RepID=UPI0024B21032|nr:ABC transporter ATP-binding protein [Rhizobium sp. CB3090]WFU12877.1 ABC transporter ATP-binding protein [Rhizobium sp. CB3090]